MSPYAKCSKREVISQNDKSPVDAAPQSILKKVVAIEHLSVTNNVPLEFSNRVEFIESGQ